LLNIDVLLGRRMQAVVRRGFYFNRNREGIASLPNKTTVLSGD